MLASDENGRLLRLRSSRSGGGSEDAAMSEDGGSGSWRAPPVASDAIDAKAEVVMAEGTFGAPMKHVSYPDGPPPTGRWEYDLVPFMVVRTAPLGDDDDVVLERL